MSRRSRVTSVLLGTDRRASLLAAGVGGVAELAALAPLVSFDLSYDLLPWLWPNPLFAVALLAGPAAVALVDGGLLGSWWVDYPVAVLVFFETYTQGFVVTPVGPLWAALTVALLPALLWGSLGYLVGRLSRCVVDRTRGSGSDPVVHL